MPFNLSATTVETDVAEMAKNTDNYLQILDKQNGDHISNNSAHHARYSDSEAITAVNSQAILSVDISGDSDTVDRFDASRRGGESGNDIERAFINIKRIE
jgi:hypothetical protein